MTVIAVVMATTMLMGTVTTMRSETQLMLLLQLVVRMMKS